MALMGSLGSGVSAMQSFVKGMGIIGDNIANSKTVGYKRQRATYSDSFSNTLRDSVPGNERVSNQTPVQFGSGTNVAATQRIFEPGSIELTGINSDLAISGNGFFRVIDNVSGQQFLTRDGAFRVDSDGYMVDKSGNYLVGLVGGGPGEEPATIERIRVDLAQVVRQDSEGRPIDASNRIVLSDGTRIQNSANGDFRVDANGRLLDTNDNIVLRNLGGTSARAVLDPVDGNFYLQDDSGNFIDANGIVVPGPADRVQWNSALHPLARTSDAEAAVAAVTLISDPADPLFGTFTDSDNNPIATANPNPDDPNQFRLAIQSWAFSRSGELVLSLNDGSSYTRAQVLLQSVQDPAALVSEGNGLYSAWQNAGAVGMNNWNIGTQITQAERAFHTANQGGLGFIQGRALEASNTDLTAEFADMITTQRAFQAGSRIISVSDEMLQEIINLKR